MTAVTRLVLMAAAIALASCSKPKPPRFINADIASCVPGETHILAGLDLESLRKSQLYPKMPPAALALAENYRSAAGLLAAYDGRQLLIIARGEFNDPPPGATLIGRNLAVSGSPEAVQAAIVQHKTGLVKAAALIERAETVAAENQIWIAALGGFPLPLTGNAANLNRLLRDTEYTTLSAKIQETILIQSKSRARNASAAAELEETLHAMITLASAAESHHSQLAELLSRIQVVRQDQTVSASLMAHTNEAADLLRALAP